MTLNKPAKPAKKYKVFKMSDGNYSGLIMPTLRSVKAWIEAAIDSAEIGEDFQFDIEVVEMTKKEIKNLPEAD